MVRVVETIQYKIKFPDTWKCLDASGNNNKYNVKSPVTIGKNYYVIRLYFFSKHYKKIMRKKLYFIPL